ncbi:MAG: sulfatase [Verrucomicrobiota bacterium]
MCAAVEIFAERPNVLFIAVDDLRPELGCYGSRAITPNIDKLAASGMRFDRAYCNQAVCGASRTSLMTGLYPEYTNERSYHVKDWRKRWAHVVTLNQHFTQNGYTTVGLGKVYHGRIKSDEVDVDHWTTWIVSEEGQYYADPRSKESIRETSSLVPGKSVIRYGSATEAADVPDEAYYDGSLALEGARQLKRIASEKAPFFLAVGFAKPHLPFNAPQKYWDLYKRDSFSMPLNIGIPPEYPEWAANVYACELRGYSDIPPANDGPASIFSDDLNLRLIHGYFASVSYVDRNIGVLLDALEDSGMANNTIVVLWGDHGFKLGEHSSWCKHTNFEIDTRVPLIIRDPRVNTANRSTEALVEFIDLYPTLSEMCGLLTPPHLQGRSFAPLFEDPSLQHRNSAYSSYPHTTSDSKKKVIGHSIRTSRYRYTEWWEVGTDQVINQILTDLIVDPGETTNLLPDQAELARDISDELRKRVAQARIANL